MSKTDISEAVVKGLAEEAKNIVTGVLGAWAWRRTYREVVLLLIKHEGGSPLATWIADYAGVIADFEEKRSAAISKDTMERMVELALAAKVALTEDAN